MKSDSDSGATLSGSGSAGSAPSPSVSAAEAAPIPGAEPALHKREFDAEGFYAALKRAVRARSVTWKTVSEATGVSQTTLTRMSQGRRPDAASLAALSAWAGLNAAHFMPSSPAYGLGSAAVARGMEAREGQDPQGLGGEAIERGPAGMRPEERAQPSLHIEPAFDVGRAHDELMERSVGAMAIAEGEEDWEKVPLDCPMLVAVAALRRAYDALRATTPTEGPAQTLTPEYLLRELLARIHGDGGHYADEHGLEKATADADAIVVAIKTELTDKEIEGEAYRQRKRISEVRYWDDWFRAGVRFGESKVRAGTLTDPEGAS